MIGYLSSSGIANGRELFLGARNKKYHKSDNGSKQYVKSGINLLDSYKENPEIRKIIDNGDLNPVVGVYIGDGVGFGKEVRKGKLGGLYYDDNSKIKYVTNEQQNIRLNDRL